jgi:DNA-binding CsgD family transcriptional regulator
MPKYIKKPNSFVDFHLPFVDLIWFRVACRHIFEPVTNSNISHPKNQTEMKKSFPSLMPCIRADKAAIILSRREREILGLIISGYTNSEIAALLYVSCRTVDTHRQNMLAKLGARNTAVLVRYAVENIQCLGLAVN